MKIHLALACLLTSTAAWADLDPCDSHRPAEWAYPSTAQTVPRNFVAVYEDGSDTPLELDQGPELVWVSADGAAQTAIDVEVIDTLRWTLSAQQELSPGVFHLRGIDAVGDASLDWWNDKTIVVDDRRAAPVGDVDTAQVAFARLPPNAEGCTRRLEVTVVPPDGAAYVVLQLLPEGAAPGDDDGWVTGVSSNGQVAVPMLDTAYARDVVAVAVGAYAEDGGFAGWSDAVALPPVVPLQEALPPPDVADGGCSSTSLAPMGLWGVLLLWRRRRAQST